MKSPATLAVAAAVAGVVAAAEHESQSIRRRIGCETHAFGGAVAVVDNSFQFASEYAFSEPTLVPRLSKSCRRRPHHHAVSPRGAHGSS